MKKSLGFKFVTPIFLLLLATSSMAGPVGVGPPVVVDGEVAPYARVKKNGVIWYPASVVGYYRQIDFSYDYATQTLFADGVETYIESLVVDDIVYVNLAPRATHSDMRPGMTALAARRDEIKSMESASSHMTGNTEALFMSEDVPVHAHPWASTPADRSGPLIDLDPTSEEVVAPHLRPGAAPPQAPPEKLPNRLPRPGESPATAEERPSYEVSSKSGVPLRVTSQGGPSQDTGSVDNLIPIPEKPKVAPEVDPFGSSGALRAAQGENSVFQVRLLQGAWQVNQSDRVLRVKIEQRNLSPVAQSNLGSFAVRCKDGARVEASRTRSYLPDGTLDPGTLRDGELVFRFAPEQTPQALELEGALKLSVSLDMQ